MKNIVLTGMPGAGKSTVGVILAKALGMSFCDTDLLIQENEGMKLQEIMDKFGIEHFKSCEEKSILGVNPQNAVVATGGSAVYSDKAMKHLKENGVIVYLKVSTEELCARIKNFSTRGIVGTGSIEEILEDRKALYEKYADITVKCDNLGMEEVVKIVIDELGGYGVCI